MRPAPGVLTVVTANVNGVRAAARRGGLAWLAAAGADVVALQEVRATHEQLHESLDGTALAAYQVAHSPAAVLGRAGVAVLTRTPPTDVREKLGIPEFDDTGRWVEVEVDTAVGPVAVVSTYVHTGEAGTPRQDEKYEFLDAMSERMAVLRRRMSRRRGHVLVTGDLNVAHREVDIKNWRGNRGKAGFLEGERAYLDRWFDAGWVDVGRVLGGDGPGPYTWWSWRGRGFDTDGGWRIDYQIATPALGAMARRAVVAKAPTYAERWSDHAPLTVTYASD